MPEPLDYCNEAIAFYEAQLKFVRVTHKYMHDPDINLPHRPIRNHTLEHVISLAEQQRAILGSEVTEEIIAAAREFQALNRRTK